MFLSKKPFLTISIDVTKKGFASWKSIVNRTWATVISACNCEINIYFLRYLGFCWEKIRNNNNFVDNNRKMNLKRKISQNVFFHHPRNWSLELGILLGEMKACSDPYQWLELLLSVQSKPSCRRAVEKEIDINLMKHCFHEGSQTVTYLTWIWWKIGWNHLSHAPSLKIGGETMFTSGRRVIHD